MMHTYPSGFMGEAVDLTAPITQVDIARNLINRVDIAPYKTIPSSVEINDMWNAVIMRDPKTRTYEFKENVLKMALRYFGAEDLMGWLKVLADSPEVGANHDDWIMETLSYVLLGYRRKTNGNAWRMILTVGGNTRGTQLLSDRARAIVGSRVVENAEIITMRGLLVRWMQQPGGFIDLCESLFTLYGAR